MREDLRTQFNQAQEKAKQVEVDLLTEENLHSKLERQRALFSSVVDQLKQAQFVSDFTSVTSHVIEPPHTLRHPVWPRPILTLALALVTGCMVGVGAVFFIDRLDQRVRSLAELRQAMDLSVLGQVGQVPADQAALVGAIGLISHSKPRSNWAEAYRAVRTNVEFLRRNKRLQVVLVTSPYSGDGKTTSASNLAISFAYASRRVLLIDGDMRRPNVDKLYDLDRVRGLSHLLKDLLPLERGVQKTTVENLDVITAGPEVDNPAELLSSPRLVKLLDEARQSYEVVIIDAPPLLAVTDPSLIGAVADGIVVVVHAATLKYHDASRIQEHLNNLGTPALGMIVNGIGHADSGYGHGYGYGYGYGYGNYHSRGMKTKNVGEAPSLPLLTTTKHNPHTNGNGKSELA
jgi:capsular exopolysaccharide synthesis family protein